MRQHVNLMAKGLLFEEQVIPWKPIAIPLALILGIGMMTGWYLWDLWRVRILEAQIQQLAIQRQRLQQEMAAYMSDIQSVTQVQGAGPPTVDQQLAAVNHLLKSRVVWSDVLREVSLIVPEGVYLTRLETTESSAPGGSGGKAPGPLSHKEGKGIRFVGFAPSHTPITSFMEAMERSPYFTDVALIYAQKGSEVGASRVGFELAGHLQGPS